MAAIAGIALPGHQEKVVQMLQKVSHRGRDRTKMLEKRGVTMQSAWTSGLARPAPLSLQMSAVWDGLSAPLPKPESLSQRTEPFALAAVLPDGLFLARDLLGVRPLYYGKTNGSLAFASEVKALIPVTEDIHEFPPGSAWTVARMPIAWSRLCLSPSGRWWNMLSRSRLNAKSTVGTARRCSSLSLSWFERWIFS